MKTIKNDIKKYVLGGGLITLGLLMGACSDSSDSKASDAKPQSNSSNLSGTAAVGSPIANGTLIAKCSDGSGFINAVQTEVNGTWNGSVANGALPCALQITGGIPNVTLHSFANQAGNINITPLTDLALALQINTLSGQSLSDWFADPNAGSASLSSVASLLAQAADALRSAMATANFNLPNTWSAGSTAIFNTAFTADPASDPYDQLLENLAESIGNDNTLADYSALLSSLTSGGTFPDAPVVNTGTPATVPASMVGKQNFKYAEAQSGSGIANGAVQEFEVMADNRLRLPSGEFLSNPVFSDNLVEIIWQDEVSNLTYALSNAKTGIINELNISQSLFGQPDYKFYGSFEKFNAGTGSAPAALLALAGNYNATVYNKNDGNRHGWVEGDTLTLSIDAATGVIDVAGKYSIDPSDSSFSWNDDTAKNPRFSPRYEVQYKDPETNISTKLILYQHPGEPLNGWRIQELAPSGPPVVNVAAEVTPFIQTHLDYFDSLSTALPATLVVISQDNGLYFGANSTTLCSEFSFTLDSSGANAKPLLRWSLWPSSASYSASSAAYNKTGSAVSLNWGGFDLEVDGQILTLTSHSLGLPLNEVLSNDPAKIAAVCPN